MSNPSSPKSDLENRPARFWPTVVGLSRDTASEWPPFLMALLALSLVTAAVLIEPRYLGLLVDEALVKKDESVLVRMGLIYFGLQIVRILATGFQAMCFARLGQNVMQRLRQRVFMHISALPMGLFYQWPTGKIVTRVTNDVSALSDMFSEGFVTIISNSAVILGIVIALISLDWKLGLISVALMPVLIGFSIHFSGRLRQAYQDSRSRLTAMNIFLTETISGMKELLMFNRTQRQEKEFHILNEELSNAQFAATRVYALFQPLITLVSGASLAAVIYFGGRAVHGAELPIGVFVTFFAYVQSLFQPVRDIADRWNIFLAGVTAAERIYEILGFATETSPETLTAARIHATTPFPGHIVFENVWFSYREDEWILKDFSATVQPGEMIGIVGTTGAGKSTLLHLLLRFYDPQRGRILLDGQDIRNCDRRELRSRFGLIQQDVFLFSGSMESNVTLMESDPAPGALNFPEYTSLLDSKTARTEAGVSEPGVSERGGNLSFGERQILAFARAAFVQPDIWILDEATSSVDSESEARLTQWLNQYGRGHTRFCVAHRLATIQSADQIWVLSRGELVESGRHHSLVQRGGLYAKYFELQFEDVF